MTRGHTIIAVTALAAGVLVAGCAPSTQATQPRSTRRPPHARPTTAAEPTKQPAPPPGNVINLTSNGPANVSVICLVEHQVALSKVISFAGPSHQAVDAPAGSTCAFSGAVPPVFTTVTPDTCDFTQPCDVTVAQSFGRNVTNATPVTADDSGGTVPPVFTTVTPDTCDFTQPCDVTVAQNYGRNVTNATPVTADDSECVRDVLAYNVGDVPTDQVVQGICHNHRP
jgi:hypothetical protein